MKSFLLLFFFLMSLPAWSATLEECRAYTNDFLKNNVIENETDEVHPYRLKSADVLSGFDTNKLGLELNHSIITKWRASCVNKPDMSVPVCDNAFPVLNFMKATITGLKKEKWDEKTKSLAQAKLKEFFLYSVKEEQNMLNVLVALSVMEEARLHGILNPDRKKLDKLRKEGNVSAQIMSAEFKGKEPDCKDGEKLYQREKKVADKIRKEFTQLLRKTL